MADVVVLGSLNIDVVVRAQRLPTAGQTVTGTSVERRPGGKGANQAAAAARAGVVTRLIGCVGDGDEGPAYRAALAERNVDVDGVRVPPDVATGHALVTVDDAGENTIVVVPGANEQVGDAEVQALRLQPADVLLLQLEVPVTAVRDAVRQARAVGCTVLLNPSPWQRLEDELLDACDTVIVNAVEAEELREAGFDMARAVVTAGSGDVRWGDVVVPAERVEDPVDTTGAGDAFAGALAAALAGGAEHRAALAAGVRAGAVAVLHDGAQDWRF
ncbi:PfkB family carbohydrate kinase [Allobranchiibius sp. GilTou73]|uniref:PfkB family carbohydrate kinase n=1 Tax=Allobranchiibius sp. GilTou73 TaxID=2904523 RepID=UPI001F2F74F4|nr:PfkB family carbohydrate kinase [Allobranchiibius sp. GilTou73]UIJ35845.1 PfkB family carbohydrate kinase [Allobranchiibius sp. GilTou73]